MKDVGLTHFLIVSTMLFFIGAYGFLTRRNVIARLIAVEVMLNAGAINLIAFNRFLWADKPDGMLFTFFVIFIAAAVSAVAIAIIIRLWRLRRDTQNDDQASLEINHGI